MSAVRQHPTRKIKYLAFGGGGWRTMYSKGVMDALAKEKILQDVEAVSVSSGGCMTGFLLALGYNSHESLQFLEKYVLDGKFQIPLTFIPKYAHSKSPYYKVTNQDFFLKRGCKALANLFIYDSLPFRNIYDAIRSGGIFHTQGLADVLWKLIQESPVLPKALKKKNLTFAELHEYRKIGKTKFPDYPFVDLFVIVTETTPDGLKEKCFSYLDTPHEPIIPAACASMAIPLIFRKVGKKRNLYDGGVINNLPRNVFDKPHFFEPEDQFTEMNMRVLAVCFVDSEATIAEWRDNCPNKKRPSKANQLLYWMMTSTAWDAKIWQAQIKEHQNGANALRTMYINCEEMPILGPKSITKDSYLAMCEQVAAQTHQYIDTYLRTPDPHLSLENKMASISNQSSLI